VASLHDSDGAMTRVLEHDRERRQVHSASERRRRSSIKQGFASLRASVPLTARERNSKTDILSKGCTISAHAHTTIGACNSLSYARPSGPVH
jgi:hypothetical protein